MSYESNKIEVLDFFQNHIIKYIVKDLEILDSIKADASGVGGCAIPQASATFSALDLMGYLTHPQEQKTVIMSFSNFLNNQEYFPSLQRYTGHADFLKSMRDDVRSIMSHRFSLAKYHITKEDRGFLFYQEDGEIVFSASHLTKLALVAIDAVYENIKNDKFIINGFDKEKTIEKMKIRIDKLKNYQGDAYAPMTGLPQSSLTTATTNRLG